MNSLSVVRYVIFEALLWDVCMSMSYVASLLPIGQGRWAQTAGGAVLVVGEQRERRRSSRSRALQVKFLSGTKAGEK